MKIIQALKEMPLIEKKIEKNISLIQKYAASIDNGRVQLFFADEATQRAQLSSLVQANTDLVAQKARIRRVLAVTNAGTNVTINGVTRSISEWIEYRQHGLETMIKTFKSLDDTLATRQAMTAPPNPTTGVRVVRFYEEQAKNTELGKLMELQNSIDTTLEIVNATTDLIEQAA